MTDKKCYRISAAEKEIGAGLIEEVIEVAEGELRLTETLFEAKMYVSVSLKLVYPLTDLIPVGTSWPRSLQRVNGLISRGNKRALNTNCTFQNFREHGCSTLRRTEICEQCRLQFESRESCTNSKCEILYSTVLRQHESSSWEKLDTDTISISRLEHENHFAGTYRSSCDLFDYKSRLVAQPMFDSSQTLITTIARRTSVVNRTMTAS